MIGRITTAGVVSQFSDPTIDDPVSITAGPDRNLWFINAGNNRGPAPATAASIGRITPAGVVSNFTSTGIQGMGQNGVSEEEITTGPDGNL